MVLRARRWGQRRLEIAFERLELFEQALYAHGWSHHKVFHQQHSMTTPLPIMQNRFLGCDISLPPPAIRSLSLSPFMSVYLSVRLFFSFVLLSLCVPPSLALPLSLARAVPRSQTCSGLAYSLRRQFLLAEAAPQAASCSSLARLLSRASHCQFRCVRSRRCSKNVGGYFAAQQPKDRWRFFFMLRYESRGGLRSMMVCSLWS